MIDLGVGDFGKWNYETKSYDPYTPDPSWVIGFYSTDMDELINCAQCGKEIKFGDGYTSREIHTPVGMGYSVCESCYEEEYNRESIQERRREA